MKQNKTRPTQGSGATYLDGITPIQKHQGYRWLDQLFQKLITKNQSFGAVLFSIMANIVTVTNRVERAIGF